MTECPKEGQEGEIHVIDGRAIGTGRQECRRTDNEDRKTRSSQCLREEFPPTHEFSWLPAGIKPSSQFPATLTEARSERS